MDEKILYYFITVRKLEMHVVENNDKSITHSCCH